MERARIFYWRTAPRVPADRQTYEFTELAWIHDQGFIEANGDGWRVVSNAIVGPIEGTDEVLMATTMVLDVESELPDAL